MSEHNKHNISSYQYPFPMIPKNWGRDEMQFAQGLRRLFDILFAKKVSNDTTPVIEVNCGTINSLPVSISNSKIKKTMKVLSAVFGTPSAPTNDWTVTTSSGALSISGTIAQSASTTLILYLTSTKTDQAETT